MAALVDKAMTLHGLPRYYDNPQPHLSFAWALGDCREQLQAAVGGLGPAGGNERCGMPTARLREAGLPAPFRVEQVVLQVGSKKHVVWDRSAAGSQG